MLFFIAIAIAQDAATPDDLLHLARERARNGDYEGARLVAGEAEAIPGEHQRLATYVVAFSWELDGDLDRALAMYDALLADRPDNEDVLFRRAECLGKLGRYEEAREQLDALGQKGRGAADLLKMRLLEATWELELRRDRKGMKRVAEALEGAAPGAAIPYQGYARHALLVHAATTAEAVAMEGSDGAKARAYERREALVDAAQAELAALVRLGPDVTELALDGFRHLAGTYEDLGDDLLAEPPMKRLSATQQEVYRDLVLEQVEKLWVKGTEYYDGGLQLGAAREWTAEPVPALLAARDALVARVEGL